MIGEKMYYFNSSIRRKDLDSFLFISEKNLCFVRQKEAFLLMNYFLRN